MNNQASYIGLEVGDSLIKSALTDSRGEVLELEPREMPRDGAGVVWETAASAINELHRRGKARGGPVVAVGVAVPGVVNPRTHRVDRAPSLPLLEHMDFYPYLSASTPLPVVLENSANAAVYGEFICGVAKGLQNIVLIDLGLDIGAGFIFGGKLYSGMQGYAGEFGHMTVNPDGWECSCGNIGCLETIASGTNLVRRTKSRLFHDRSSSLSSLALPGRGELTPERIAIEAVNGDDFALMMLDRTGSWLGMAVANVINLLNLDMVILAGGIMAAGDLFIRSVAKEVQARALEVPRTHCRIVASTLGAQAGPIGVAMLARDTIQG